MQSRHQRKQESSGTRPCDDEFMLLAAGFFYDSRANDYKLIRFGFDRLLTDTREDEEQKADIYSMRTDSWREIGIHLDLSSFAVPNREIFWQGVFYWPIFDFGYVIVSFDVFDEVFGSVSLPDCLSATGEVLQLDVWNESVTVFSFPFSRDQVPVSIKVWVLDDCFGGVKGSCSWIKKLNIGPLVEAVRRPWTFWKTDELLLETSDEGLISYNLHSQIVRKLTIQGVARLSCFQTLYVKSLVSVQGGQQAR